MSTVRIGTAICKFNPETLRWRCGNSAMTDLANSFIPEDAGTPRDPNVPSSMARILKDELKAEIIFEPETKPIDPNVIY